MIMGKHASNSKSMDSENMTSLTFGRKVTFDPFGGLHGVKWTLEARMKRIQAISCNFGSRKEKGRSEGCHFQLYLFPHRVGIYL